MKNLKKHTQETAAAIAGMDVKTARKYIKNGKLPKEVQKPHTWKTKVDPFAKHWSELTKMLELSPGLEAKTLLSYLMDKYPEQYTPNQLRTLQRRVRDWRAEYGNNKSIIFHQDIKPGKQSQSDWTCMNSLNVTINGQKFSHLFFHFILPYSHWESVKLSFSESFESLICGYEKAVWELGYVAAEHRTDNLTAATHAMGSRREFNDRWLQFIAHYDVTPTTNNVGESHENGSVEKSHDNFKRAVEQSLLLRGSRDFVSEIEYINFIEDIVKSRNLHRKVRLAKEIPLLHELPEKKWHSPIIVVSRVTRASTLQILKMPYSVPSRLIGYTLKAYVYPDEIIIFYGNKQLQCMPRVHEISSAAGINYRHLIDSLVRKPGAFTNYRYQEALFPRLCFRQAYDALRKSRPATADKQYLKLLQLAKQDSEQQVATAIELMLEEKQLPTHEHVKALIDAYREHKQQVQVHEPNLEVYDTLLPVGNLICQGENNE